MTFARIEHYRFTCDAPPREMDSSPHCGATSPIVEGQDLTDAAWWCEHRHGWLIVMGNETPLFTYCPEHADLAPELRRV